MVMVMSTRQAVRPVCQVYATAVELPADSGVAAAATYGHAQVCYVLLRQAERVCICVCG